MKKIRQLKNGIINIFGNVNTKKYWNNRWLNNNYVDKRLFIYDDILLIIDSGIKTVLDVGCGNGDFCNVFKKEYPKVKVEGCDFSKKGLKIAKERNSGCNFFLLNIITQNIKKDYDMIFLISVLEHISDYRKVIDKCIKKCKWLVISCPYNEKVSTLGIRFGEHLHSFNDLTLKDYKPIIYVNGKRIIYLINGFLEDK